MNQVLDFVNQNKEYIVLGIAIVGGVVVYGKSKAKNFVVSELKKLEADTIATVKSNPVAFITEVYGKLPKALKAFVTINQITQIVSKFLDK